MEPSTYDKSELEKRVRATFDNIDLGTQHQLYINDKSYQDFSNAWGDLQHYYERTRDPIISIAVVDTYLEQTKILRGMFDRAEIDQEQRASVKRALMSLEIKMQKICQSVVNYNPEDD